MREALPGLREALPGVRLVLAAMGPKMSALGGAEWDGVFFNWMTPEFAAQTRERVEEGAREAGRDTPPVFGYVRTAVGRRRRGAARQGRVLLSRHAPGLPQPLRPAGRPEGTVGVAAENAGVAQEELSATARLTPSSSGLWPAPPSRT